MSPMLPYFSPSPLIPVSKSTTAIKATRKEWQREKREIISTEITPNLSLAAFFVSPVTKQIQFHLINFHPSPPHLSLASWRKMQIFIRSMTLPVVSGVMRRRRSQPSPVTVWWMRRLHLTNLSAFSTYKRSPSFERERIQLERTLLKVK